MGEEVVGRGLGESTTRYASTAISSNGKTVALGVPGSQAKGGVKVFEVIVDAFPLDATESVDSDGDGVGDNGDAFPEDAAESVDTDSDGIGNNSDTDDDGDGVADTSDAFPLDATETLDTDSDGTGNNADADDDGDGVSDYDEAAKGTDPLLVDTDGDDDWVRRGSDIDGEAASDVSGIGVSLSTDGSIVAIGAYGNDGNGSDAGHVRLYAWNGSSWVQRGSDIDGEAEGDFSGYSVSVSADGSVVAIGAFNNDGNGDTAGHVRIYAWNGADWVQRGSDIDGETAWDSSGWAVSLSSDGLVVAIGAYRNDGTANSAGHVRVYVWDGSTWVQRGSDIDGEAYDDASGVSVSLSADGSVVAIGAQRNDGNGSDAGHVRLYAWNGSSWVQRGSDIDGEAAGDLSGASSTVSLSADGSVVAIGAQRNDGNGSDAGHVRLYAWNGSSWAQRGSDIDGEAAGDASGASVSLSADGSVVAIGAGGNDGNGSDAGHVRLYAWNGSSWVQRGSDIDGEAAGDESGASVSLSADGSVVAIGAFRNDGTGQNAGHVRIFKVSGTNDNADNCPLVANADQLNTDGDAFGDGCDTDDDGDGVADTDDAFPLDANETLDTDSDGIGNNADTDDDGDGVADSSDAFPLDALRQ